MFRFGSWAMASVLVCGLVACSDDENPTNKCEKEESTACANAFGTCKAPCLADEACHYQCQVDFCQCMDKASCDPPAECTDNPLDSGTNTQDDAGITPEEDSGTVEEDSGTVEECDGSEAAACNQTQATCLAGCLGDLACQDDCLADYCTCLFAVGCEDTENCV